MRVLGVDPGLTRCGSAWSRAPRAAAAAGRTSTWSAPRPTDLAQRLLHLDAALDRAGARAPAGRGRGRAGVQPAQRAHGDGHRAGRGGRRAGRRPGRPAGRLHTPSEVKAAVTGSGRADKAQVTTMVTRLLRLAAPPAGRRRRRAGAGDLPRLARPAQDRLQSPRWPRHGAPVRSTTRRAEGIGPVIASVQRHGRRGRAGRRGGRGRRRRPGRPLHPGHARRAAGRPAGPAGHQPGRPGGLADPVRLRRRRRASLFELLQTASGVGPRLAQAVLAVHPPSGCAGRSPTADVTALTRVPGSARRAPSGWCWSCATGSAVDARRRGRAGCRRHAGRAVARPGRPGAGRARLVGREADQAVAAVAPEADEQIARPARVAGRCGPAAAGDAAAAGRA